MKKVARSALPERLLRKRRELDLINQKLLTLLNQRLRIALEVGKVKKGLGKRIYDKKREIEILDRLRQKNRGPLKEKDLRKIFTMIMKVCRQSQIEADRRSKSQRT